MSTMLSISQLRVLIHVADHGGIRAAAERLCRTPSAVSMALKQLEEEFGTPVFEGDRKTKLTRFGEFVYDQARSLLEHHERVHRSIEAYAHNSAGNVDVAVLPSVAVAFLPEVLSMMQAQAPTIAINARDLDSGAVQEAVAREAVEIGVSSHRPSPDIIGEPLFSEPLMVVCREGDPLCAVSGPITWSMVSKRKFIGNGSYDGLVTPEFLAILERHTLHVRSVISLLAVVRAGVGITVLPGLSHLQWNDGVRFLPIDDAAAIRTVHVMWRADRNLSPAARRFITVLREAIGERAGAYGLKLLSGARADSHRSPPAGA